MKTIIHHHANLLVMQECKMNYAFILQPDIVYFTLYKSIFFVL